MLLPTTEMRAIGGAIDTMSSLDAAALYVRGQCAAIEIVAQVAQAIDLGATAMADAVGGGHSIVYAAAGSSGLMALADACELSGTFGIADDLVQVHMAGGIPTSAHMPGDTEDETEAAERIGNTLHEGDLLIVLSASGTTPYAVAAADSARANGATVIAIANNPKTALLESSDIAICLPTPPEVIAGSTRLGGATAQKAALNLMSSLMGVKLGHVYQGLMVNVIADNAKLVGRAVGIIAQVSNVSTQNARTALAQADGHTKTAILVAAGSSLELARAALNTHNGHLGPCFETLNLNHDQTN